MTIIGENKLTCFLRAIEFIRKQPIMRVTEDNTRTQKIRKSFENIVLREIKHERLKLLRKLEREKKDLIYSELQRLIA